MRTLLAFAAILLAATACGDDPADPASRASESPTTTRAPSESTSVPTETATPPDSISLTTEGLAEGQQPAVPYLAAADPKESNGAWRLVRPDGTSVPVPDGGFSSFAPMGEGLVGISADGERPAAIVVDGAGKTVRRAPARGYGLAVSPDGTIVGWLGASGAPQVLEGGGSRSYDLPVVDGGSDIAAVLGKKTCKEVPPEYGCTVFVNSADASQAWVSTSHGFVDTAGTMKSVADAAPTRVIGVVSSTDEGSCSGLWEKPRRPVWTTCDYTLFQLSVDGSRVLGTDPYLDGLGQRTLAFLDAEGRVLQDFRSPRSGPTIVRMAWEDADHALAVVLDGDAWSVLRLGVDGSMEYAVAPVRGDDVVSPFVLPEG
jgi:hypothetical protein